LNFSLYSNYRLKEPQAKDWTMRSAYFNQITDENYYIKITTLCISATPEVIEYHCSLLSVIYHCFGNKQWNRCKEAQELPVMKNARINALTNAQKRCKKKENWN